MTHDVVICTRNRPADLESALESLAAQTRLPSSVLIVDASDGDASRALVQSWSEAGRGGLRLGYLAAAPGLPAQRNLGADRSSADVVHFIDDDVVLEPGYLAALAEVFEQDGGGTIAGAGGLITNLPPREPRLWWRLALMDSKRSGATLCSGVSVIVTAADAPLSVQWLSGCSMSFRTEIVRRLRFDEALRGYALMEDVDFSFRAGRVGRLVLEPRARLVHTLSRLGRWHGPSRHRAGVCRRGWFVEKNLPRWCLIPFWWSVFAGAVVQCGVALAKRERGGLRLAAWRLQGALDFVRGVR